jgi:hypothetical protein
MYRELLGTFTSSPFHPLVDLSSLVGPAVEAFGFQHIIFGSAPSPASRFPSTVEYR